MDERKVRLPDKALWRSLVRQPGAASASSTLVCLTLRDEVDVSEALSSPVG